MEVVDRTCGSLMSRGGIGTLFVYFNDTDVTSFYTRDGCYRMHGLSYNKDCGRRVDYFFEGVEVTDALLTLVKDPQNLEPHEVGLVKLKYNLTQGQLQIPYEVFEAEGLIYEG